MKYLLDTDICIYLIKKQNPEIWSRLLKAGIPNAGLSAITLAELKFGAENSRRPLDAKAALMEFTLPFEILDFNASAAACYGRIRKDLKDKGRPVGEMDMLIAATAMADGRTLVSNNEKEFRSIPGLKVENWVS